MLPKLGKGEDNSKDVMNGSNEFTIRIKFLLVNNMGMVYLQRLLKKIIPFIFEKLNFERFRMLLDSYIFLLIVASVNNRKHS